MKENLEAEKAASVGKKQAKEEAKKQRLEERFGRQKQNVERENFSNNHSR